MVLLASLRRPHAARAPSCKASTMGTGHHKGRHASSMLMPWAQMSSHAIILSGLHWRQHSSLTDTPSSHQLKSISAGVL
jgi:hypothetical protein